jgi:hypothetical protein
VIGSITSHSAAIVRRPIGTRRHQGMVLQLAVTPRGSAPVIRCPETGKVWSITWEALMDLAISEGVSTPIEEALETSLETEE